MPDNKLEQDGLYGRINALEEEIADLQYSNQKLYKDCVTFAKKLKKIQLSGVLDEDIDGLKDLNSQYVDEIASLKEQIVALTIENQNMRESAQSAELQETLDGIDRELPEAFAPERTAPKPAEEVQYADEIAAPSRETLKNIELAEATRTGNTVSFRALKLDDPDSDPDLGPAMTRSNSDRARQQPKPAAPHPVNSSGKRPVSRRAPLGRRIFRGILQALLAIVLLVALVSAVVGLYAHTWTDATFCGIRCYTVRNDAMDPVIQIDDVVVVKKIDMTKLDASDVILSTRNGRAFGVLEAIETRDNVDYLVVADNSSETYNVDPDEYLGKAVYRIAGLGHITKYALTHRINYFAVLLSTTLVLIALLILFPSKKNRRRDQPRFGVDYTVEDFTI